MPKADDKSFLNPHKELTEAITALHKFLASNLAAATKRDVEKAKDEILQELKGNMAGIQTFITNQNAFNARQEKAIDGLVTDFKTLTDLIEQLQTNPGPISTEDQAALDQLEQRADAITAKLEALDAQTPPVVPSGSGDGGPTPPA